MMSVWNLNGYEEHECNALYFDCITVAFIYMVCVTCVKSSSKLLKQFVAMNISADFL